MRSVRLMARFNRLIWLSLQSYITYFYYHPFHRRCHGRQFRLRIIDEFCCQGSIGCSPSRQGQIKNHRELSSLSVDKQANKRSNVWRALKERSAFSKLNGLFHLFVGRSCTGPKNKGIGTISPNGDRSPACIQEYSG